MIPALKDRLAMTIGSHPSKARSLAMIGAGRPSIAAAMLSGADTLPERDEVLSCLAPRDECTFRVSSANLASQA